MDDSTIEMAKGSVENKDQFTYTSIFSLQQETIPLDRVGAGACRSVNEFEKIRKLGEGTYGIVYEGLDKVTGEKVALKQVRLDMKKEGVSISVIREIYSLMDIEHVNIVRLFDCAVGRKIQKIFLVMEYCNQDLASLLDNMQSPFTESQVKCLLVQLLGGLNHLHKSFLIHRDIKVSNLLLTDNGILKIADFGLARLFSDPPTEMTPRVVTLWYRSPELLFGSKFQSTPIGAVFKLFMLLFPFLLSPFQICGLVAAYWYFLLLLKFLTQFMGELLLHKPLLPGRDEIDQVRRIIHLLGTPTERIWPGLSKLTLMSKVQLFNQPYNNIKVVFPNSSPDCIDLLNRLFAYDPARRATAAECLESEYLNTSPLPCDPSMMPSLTGLTRKSRKRGPAE